MLHLVLSRRGFLASALALLVRGASRDAHDCAHGNTRIRGPHPTPRPGITAAHVLAADRLADASPSARAAFAQVREILGVVDGIRCHCGCADNEGNYSLLSCYEGDGMARHCQLCQGQARMAYRLHRDGRTLNEIRTAIDERYG